ncbi:hypothetical protein ACEN4K_03755 [Marinilactibacillus psychrotolerans]|uniref:hypothetical protein n=1 Tax=Marinilactibacillus psychrotolerans TaxID=191770 RepID=UPI00388623B2
MKDLMETRINVLGKDVEDKDKKYKVVDLEKDMVVLENVQSNEFMNVPVEEGSDLSMMTIDDYVEIVMESK